MTEKNKDKGSKPTAEEKRLAAEKAKAAAKAAAQAKAVTAVKAQLEIKKNQEQEPHVQGSTSDGPEPNLEPDVYKETTPENNPEQNTEPAKANHDEPKAKKAKPTDEEKRLAAAKAAAAAKEKAAREQDSDTADADEKAKAIAIAKAKAAAAAKAKAAAAAKAKAQAKKAEQSGDVLEGKSADESTDETSESGAKAKAAAAKATAAAKAKAGREQAGETADVDEKAKAAAAAKAKAAAVAKAKAAAAAKAKAAATAKAKARAAGQDGGEVEDKPKEPSKNQPYLDKYVKVLTDNIGEGIIEEAYINELAKDVPTLVIKQDKWLEVAQFLKHNEQLAFDYVSDLHGSDFEEHMEVYYHFYSYKERQSLAVRIKLDRDEPRVATVTPLWDGADWPERETYDLLGIQFEGHPNLTRILLTDDWVGYPLRKDYEQFDEEV